MEEKKNRTQKSKARGNGEGSIYKVKNKNLWAAAVTIGLDENGKPKRKVLYGKTRPEVRDKLKAFNIGDYVLPSDITIEQYIEKINNEDRILLALSDNTFATRKCTLNRIKKHPLSKMPLQKVTENDVKKYLKTLSGYAENTIKKDFVLLSRCFNSAESENIILKNPMKKLKCPKSAQPNIKTRAMTIQEQQAFIKILNDNNVKYSIQFKIMLLTGLRMGEVNALKASDYNRIFSTLTVQRTISRDENGLPVIGGQTKTEKGMRVIPLSPAARLLIEKAISLQIPNRFNLLFVDRKGNLITTSQTNSVFKRTKDKYPFIDESQIGKVTVHSLRHTYATRCIESGMNVKTVSVLLGHEDIETTLNTYCDAFDNMQKDNTDKANEYMRQIGII